MPTWLIALLAVTGWIVIVTLMCVGNHVGTRSNRRLDVLVQLHDSVRDDVRAVDGKLTQLAEVMVPDDIAEIMAKMSEPELRGLADRVTAARERRERE